METNCLQYNASNDTVCEYMYIVILVYYMYRYTWKHFFFKKHFCNDIITCWTNSIFWSSGCTNIDKFVTSFVKINGVSYSLPFFFATVFRNPVFTSWYVSLSPLFTLHVRVSFTSFRVFFFLPDFVSWRSYQRYVFDQSSKKCGPWWKVWQRVAKPCCLAGAWRFLEKLQGPVATFFGDSTVTKPCLTWIMKV